jgi:septal ring factor EnvC (AmiA/AmiB activator)
MSPLLAIDVKKSDSSHSSAEEDRLHHEIESKNNIIVNQSKQIAELTVQLQAVQRAVSDFQAAIAKILSNNP